MLVIPEHNHEALFQHMTVEQQFNKVAACKHCECGYIRIAFSDPPWHPYGRMGEWYPAGSRCKRTS